MNDVALALGVLAVVWAAVATTAKVVVPRRLNRRVRESLRAFSIASELRFPLQKGESDRIVFLVGEVGRRLQLPAQDIARLQMAVRLRGIGLCAVPYRLLNGRDPAAWTAAERAVFRRHTEVSGAMLELLPPLRHLADPVRESAWPTPWPQPLASASHHRAETAGTVSGDELGRRVLEICSQWVVWERFAGRLGAERVLAMGSGQPSTCAVFDALGAVLRSSRAQEPEAGRPA